jgi:WD40-like Beta Propeller Repeat
MKSNIKRIILSLIILSGSYTYGQSINYADSLNMRDVSDAFPFISGDGLRIYYESSRNSSDGSIFYSSRTNTKSYFKAPVLLGQQFDGSFGSPTLTSDELTIYVLNSKTKQLFSASRKLRTDAFGALAEVKVLAKNAFYLPAISASGKQLVVTDYENEYLIFFELNKKNEVLR